MMAALLGLLALVAVDAHGGHAEGYGTSVADPEKMMIDFARPVTNIEDYCNQYLYEAECTSHDCCRWDDPSGKNGVYECTWCGSGDDPDCEGDPGSVGQSCGFGAFCETFTDPTECESTGGCCGYFANTRCDWNVGLGRTCAGAGYDLYSEWPVYKLPDDKSAASKDCGPDTSLLKNVEKGGFDKVTCPFGVLIIGSDHVPENDVKFAANVLAQLLDPDENGAPDSREVQKALTFGFSSAPVFVMGGNDDKEMAGAHLFYGYVGYAYGSQMFKGDGVIAYTKNLLVHELHHLVHQQGWAYVWPEVFGNITERSYISDDDDDALSDRGWDPSVVCAETALHQCTYPGWRQEENECPNGDDKLPPGHPAPSPLKGDCNIPACDCVEFHRQAALTWAGQYDVGLWDTWSHTTPSTSVPIKKMLSDEYQAMLRDKKYSQVQKRLTGEYKFPTTSQALAARLSDEGRVKDTVPVKISSLVVLCVLAGVALGSALTLLAKESKAKEPTEQEPLLAKA